MESRKSKYPGFIDGLKSSNIATNITSLKVYSEQIENLLIKISDNKNLTSYENDTLEQAKSAIKESYNEEYSPNDLLQYYIKFGDIFNSISNSINSKADKENLRIIAKDYLLIAKYTKDTRIKNLAISIAKDLE